MCCHLALAVGTGEFWLGDEELKGLGCLGWEGRHGKLFAPSLFSLPAQPGGSGQTLAGFAALLCSGFIPWAGFPCRSHAVRNRDRGWGVTCTEGGVTVRLTETRAAGKQWPGGAMGHLWHLGCPALPGTLISGCCSWHRAEAAEQRKVSNAWRGPGGHRNLLEADPICMMPCKQDGFCHGKPSVETSNH